MYQFFVEPSQIQGNRIVITGSDVNHIKNVLRMKPGEEIAVSNGTDGKEYRCGIEELLEEEIICTLRFIKEDGLELPARVTFFQGLPKADKMEFIVQKLVELGAYRIVPVALKRSVVHLDEKKAKARQARWQSIVSAACARQGAGMAGALQPALGACGLVVSVLPINAQHPLALRQVPMALVVMNDPTAPCGLAPRLVAEVLGLSPAETRLALLLASGKTVKDFAAAEDVSWHTARTHQKNLLRKTGCHRQQELVGLLLALRLG